MQIAKDGETDAREAHGDRGKNGNSLKRLSEAVVSLIRRRLVCFPAYVKLNSPGNFTPTALYRIFVGVSQVLNRGKRRRTKGDGEKARKREKERERGREGTRERDEKETDKLPGLPGFISYSE